MKFDVVRAWKDENYRQTLSQEQLEMLPANPAGELDEEALATVHGGYYGGFGAASSASATAASTRFHSLALLCDISLFSINLLQIELVPIASPTSQVCAESH